MTDTPSRNDSDKLISDEAGLDRDWGEVSLDRDWGEKSSGRQLSHDEPAIAPAESVSRPLDFILDIPLEISVELGRAKMVINDLLRLGRGSVIELSKLAGEPLEILVNGKLVARGEAVVINEKFGVRVTDIVSRLERVKSLS